VDRVGGDFNAFTAREYTCFHVTLLARDVDLGMDILSDILLNSDFDAEEFDRERKVILQEVSMVDDSPEEIAHDVYYELAYGSHGLGRPILGTESSLKKIRRGDVIRYFRKHYRPEQIIISVAGDVTHETLKKKLKALARREWPGRQRLKSKKELGFEPAPKLKEGWWWIKRDTEQVHLLWGVQGPHYASKDRFAANLLNIHLGGSMSSSLFQEIRERHGLAYTVYSSLSPYHDTGIFSIYAATSMTQLPLCLKLIEECVEKLRKDLLTDEELHTAKENLKGTVLLAADSVESRMQSIAYNEIFMQEYLSTDEICRRIDEVTAADVRRLLRKLLKDGKRSILALGPKPSKPVQQKLKPTFPKRWN
jgi:predicted Zn-dependent peptidase